MSRSITLAAVAAAVSAVLLSGCASPLPQQVKGYTCCNLPVESEGIVSSYDTLGASRIPAGAPAQFNTIKRSYVYGEIGGQSYTLRNDIDRKELTTLDFLHHVIVPEDPNVVLATWPANVQASVRTFRVRVGMTRPQVLMAIGYPPSDDTPDLSSRIWKYYVLLGDQQVFLKFGDDGTLLEVVGKPSAVQQVLDVS